MEKVSKWMIECNAYLSVIDIYKKQIEVSLIVSKTHVFKFLP